MDNDTKKLRAELVSMLDALYLKVEQLENRLTSLESKNLNQPSNLDLSNKTKTDKTLSTKTPAVAAIPEQSPKLPVEPEPTSREVLTPPAEKKTADTTATVAKNASLKHDDLVNKIVNGNKTQATQNTSQPSSTTKATTPVNNNAIASSPVFNPLSVVGEFLTLLLGPFGSLYHQVMKVYYRYQEQGRGPVFLMTAAGILALVMGFGFLLQYSFSNYLGIGGKITTGFISAIAMVALGMKISNKSTLLSEFGAAIIGLGIILNYLCAYFISGHFNLVGPTIGLGLLAAITFSAYWLAIHYDTKTVAVLSLVGGASTPLFLGDLSQISTVYFIYLTFLVATMLHLAHKIKWPSLIQFTLIISITMTQYLLLEQAENQLVNNVVFIVLLHILFYLFSYACLFNIGKSKQEIDKSILLSVVGNIIFFVFVLYQVISVEHYLGWTYLLNAIVLLLFYRFNWLITYAAQKIKNDFNALLILQTGLLIGFGILYLVSPSLLGLIWGVEGLALIYVGFRFAMPSIRFEGHIAFLIGMGSAAIEAILWFSNGIGLEFNSISSISLNYDTGWMNLIVFGLVLWLAARLLQHNHNQSLQWEKTACLWSHEIFSVWLSLAFMISFLVVMSNEILLLSVVPLFILLYRAKKYQLPLSEVLGLAHYFLFIIQIFISANQVNSFSTSDQDWVGIFVRIEAFVTLWLIAEFYSRFYPKSNYALFARTLRIIFYVLIPLLFIPKMIKTYDAFLPMSIWASAAIALFLYTRVKYYALKVEFYILVATAWVITVIASIADYESIWNVEAQYALLTGLVYFAITSFIWKAFSDKAQKPALSESESKDSAGYYTKIVDYIQLHYWSVYYLATCIFIVTFGLTENILFTILISSIYFMLLCIYWPKIIPAKPTLKLSYSILIILSSITLFLSFYNYVDSSFISLLFLISQLVFLGLLVHKSTKASELLWSYFGGHNKQRHLWSIFYVTLSLFIITYSLTFNIQLAILLCSIYFTTLCIIWPKFSPADISVKFSYFMIIVFSIISLFITLSPFQYLSVFTPVYLIVHAGLLGYLLHKNTSSSQLSRNYFGGYLTQLWMFNIFIILVYSATIYYWIPNQLRILLSLMLVLHATILLMLTLKENFEGLLKLSVILFVGSAIKILMFDMADFSLVQKIIAFMIIGGILLGASYFYQKVQQKTNPVSTE